METIIVVFGLIVRKVKLDGPEILLIQESNKLFYGKWFLPGGKIEENENILDAIKREIKEEAGINVKVNGLFYFDETKIVMDGKDIRRLKFTFLCTPEYFTEKIIEDEHSIQSKWIPFEEIRNYELRDPFVMDILTQFEHSENILDIVNFKMN